VNPLPTEPRPDLVVLVARGLGRAARAVARFAFETLAGWGLRLVLPARETAGSSEKLAAPAELEREEALRRPWSDAGGFPRALTELGILLEALRVAPGDAVVELGGGEPGWRSHFLNLYGCPTVTIDSQAATLDATRVLFRRHPGTRWDLDPRFVSSDGRRIPLADDSCDRLLLPSGPPPDAPPAELAADLFRVTRRGGRIVLRLAVRPGRGRATAALESFAREARRAGFTAVTVVPWSSGAHEILAEGLRRFLGGRGLLAFWRRFSREQLAGHHTLILSKGTFVPSTRRPGRLAGRIEVPPRRDGHEPLWLEAEAGTATKLGCRLHNLGDTRWLGGPRIAGELGSTRLALRLGHAHAPQSAMVPWHHLDLPRDVAPTEVLEIEIELPELPVPGDYRLGLALEAEGRGAFGAECPEVELRLQVR
jgi:SAM-dependent methyltransferase